MNVRELVDDCFNQKNEAFVYDTFDTHIIRCIKNLTYAAENAKDNAQAVFFQAGKQRGSAVSIADCIVELLAMARKYDLPIERAFDIVMNKKPVKI